jgi:protein-tyrosine phosphatase
VSDWFRSYGFADVRNDVLIGAYPLDSADVKVLERLGVRHILNLVEDQEYPEGERPTVETALADSGIEETRMTLVDYGELPPAVLEQAVNQAVDWLRAGERTYIHCRAGWQRSAAVAAGVVAVLDGVSIEEALVQVHTRKPSAVPLPHQREDLVRWWNERAESGSGSR